MLLVRLIKYHDAIIMNLFIYLFLYILFEKKKESFDCATVTPFVVFLALLKDRLHKSLGRN